jgi:hypothetical protein
MEELRSSLGALWRWVVTGVFIVSLLVANGAPVSIAAAARVQAGCSGITGWYAEVGNLEQQLVRIEGDSAGNAAMPSSTTYRQMAESVDQVGVPAAKQATRNLVKGYEDLAEYVDDSANTGQTGSTYGEIANSATQLSTARHQIVEGYLAWSQLGATCGVTTTTTFQIQDQQGCEGVSDFLNTAEAVYHNWWVAWQTKYDNDRKRNQDGTAADWGTAIAPAENLMNFAYEGAFDLATASVSPNDLAIQTSVVENFLAFSDLYAIDMLSAFAGLYGLDQSGIDQLTSQFSDLSDLTIRQHDQIAQNWSDLAGQCGAGARFPALPIPK